MDKKRWKRMKINGEECFVERLPWRDEIEGRVAHFLAKYVYRRRIERNAKKFGEKLKEEQRMKRLKLLMGKSR